AVAVLQHPEQLYQLGMHAVDPDLEDRALARLAHRFLDLLLGLAHDLLDAAGMDAAVGDQALERDARDLAPDRAVAGNDDRLGGIVDDDIDAGGGLDRADVAPLAADDPALHLVVGQGKHRHRALGDELAGQAFDRDRDDALGAAVGFLARLLLDHPDLARGVMARLPDHLVDQLAARLLAGQPGDRLELGPRGFNQRLLLALALAERLFARAQGLVAAAEFGLAPLEVLQAFIDAFLARGQLALQRGQLTALLAHLSLGLRARVHQQIFSLEFRLLDYQFALGLGFFDENLDFVPRSFGAGDERASPRQIDREDPHRGSDYRQDADYYVHLVVPPWSAGCAAAPGARPAA